MPDTDPAVEAWTAQGVLAKALGAAHVGEGHVCAFCRDEADAVLATLRPIIEAEKEAEVRERIAAEIEAERDRVWIEPNLVLVNGAQVLDRHVYAAQWTEAARIARGQS